MIAMPRTHRLVSVIQGSVLLYVLALHTSIAAMEILAWLIVALMAAEKIRRRQRVATPLALPLLALAAIVALSLLVNPLLKPFWMQMGFMRWIVLLWGFGAACELVWSNTFVRRLRWTWITGLAFASLYGVFQFLTGIDFFRTHPLDPVGPFYRATGFFSMSLTYAYVMGISFFALCGSGLDERSERKPMQFIFIATALGSLGMIASGSRGAWGAAIVAGCLFIAIAYRRFLPVFLIGTSVIVFALSRFSSKLNDLLHLNVDDSTNIRFHLWKAYSAIVADHPWLGVGLLQGDKYLPDYYQRLGIEEEFVSHAHNVLLYWAAGTGVFGMLLYVFVSFWFLRAAWSIRRNSTWGWPLFLAQVYWHVGSLSEANFYDGEVNHFIIFTWALTWWTSQGEKALDASSKTS